MIMRTLIAYASKHGSARNCARLLADSLSGETTLCNLSRDKAPDPAGFDQVIVGGSIYIGKVRPEVTKYLTRYQAELLTKKLGLFICCMATGPDADAQLKAAFPNELQAHAAYAGCLGGGFTFSDMNWLERKMILAITNKTPGAQPVSGKEDIDNLDREAISRLAAAFNL